MHTNFDLTEEQQAIRDTVRRFAREKIAPIAAQLDESQEFPQATIKELGEMGILGIGFPVLAVTYRLTEFSAHTTAFPPALVMVGGIQSPDS